MYHKKFIVVHGLEKEENGKSGRQSEIFYSVNDRKLLGKY